MLEQSETWISFGIINVIVNYQMKLVEDKTKQAETERARTTTSHGKASKFSVKTLNLLN